MALPAWLVTSQLSRLGGGHAAALSALLAGAITGASVYLGAQRCLGSPELSLLREALQSARASRAGNEVLDPEGTLPNAAADRDIGTVAELEGAGEARYRRPIRVGRMSVPTLLLVGLLAGFAVIRGPLALAAAAAVALIAVSAASPAVGAYVVLGVGPLVMGIDRGQVLPLLRPNEAVLLLVASGVCARRLWERLEGSAAPLRVGARRRAVELSLLAMAGSASLIPLLWLKARGQPVTQDDVLYAITLWKYLVLYAVIRTAVRTQEEVRRCLGVILGSSAVVAVLAMLQSAGVAGIPGLLSRIFGSAQADATSGGRGSSTLGSAIAVGDVCAFCAAISLAWLLVGNGRRRAAALTLLFVAGSMGSGQFSGVLALLVAVVAVALVLRQGRRVMQRVGPYLLVAAVVLLPVISQRLAGFSGGHLPSSWSNRLSNLETFFWPRLGKDFGWLLGVQPAARIPDPHRAAGFVWIESGYTWLLWSGGLPLLIAFLVFLATGLSALRNAVHFSVDPPTRVAAVAGYAALWVFAVLMFFDPHLTLRGAADLFFPLLALALVGSGSDAVPAPEASLVTALVRRSPQAGLPLALKRGVDVVLSAFLLIVLAPVLLLVAVAVRLDSPGPAIYRGVRLGRGGIPFVALKFRTMRADADDQLHAQQLKDEVSGRLGPLDSYKVPADPRITRVGAVLRKLSIDEFPQLINVLAGDMSLVGPRPEVPYALEDYRPGDWRRFDVIPGMTGLWQVSGRSRLSQLEMLALDAEYADRWSLLLDARVLISTPAALVRGDGAQ
jgi:lipopolysaccharide/colanic/teichoic acid biosynthesis glycosyltransferase